MKKRSVNILGHATSITLEEEFWVELKTEATARDLSLNALVAQIDDARTQNTAARNLSSALRLHVLRGLKTREVVRSPTPPQTVPRNPTPH